MNFFDLLPIITQIVNLILLVLIVFVLIIAARTLDKYTKENAPKWWKHVRSNRSSKKP